MIVTLDEMRQHLNFTDSQTMDNALIERQLKAAQAHIERLLGFKIEAEFVGSDVPEDLKHGVCILAAHWYENRESSFVGVTAQEIPFGVREIVREYRNWSF